MVSVCPSTAQAKRVNIYNLDPPGQDIDFRQTALETLDDIESPLDFIFKRPKFTDSLRTPLPLDPRAALPEQFPRTVRGRARVEPAVPQALFLRDETVSPPAIVKMVCPDCKRMNFPNMQGLLNHCRLAHQKHFGSHDEGMQACAAAVASEEEKDWLLVHGMELVGVSRPSVRRLFEMAVGGSLPTFAIPAQPGGAIDEGGEALKNPASSTHLSRTLGHHKDTPALAAFLGRAPKRRCINVYDEDVDVDISTTEDASVGGGRVVWRMQYEPRSSGNHEDDTITAQPPSVADDTLNPPAQIPARPPDGGGSRFHITARIIVADRSQWLPPSKSSGLLLGRKPTITPQPGDFRNILIILIGGWFPATPPLTHVPPHYV